MEGTCPLQWRREGRKREKKSSAPRRLSFFCSPSASLCLPPSFRLCLEAALAAHSPRPLAPLHARSRRLALLPSLSLSSALFPTFFFFHFYHGRAPPARSAPLAAAARARVPAGLVVHPAPRRHGHRQQHPLRARRAHDAGEGGRAGGREWRRRSALSADKAAPPRAAALVARRRPHRRPHRRPAEAGAFIRAAPLPRVCKKKGAEAAVGARHVREGHSCVVPCFDFRLAILRQACVALFRLARTPLRVAPCRCSLLLFYGCWGCRRLGAARPVCA